jgi:hypothetical protein
MIYVIQDMINFSDPTSKPIQTWKPRISVYRSYIFSENDCNEYEIRFKTNSTMTVANIENSV